MSMYLSKLCSNSLGFTLYGLFQAGMLLGGLNVNFTISSALLFGTICAAVDPVAVSPLTQ